MTKEIYQKLAKLILQTGINLQPGGKINLTAEPILWPFLNILTEEAYKMGACFIKTHATHPLTDKARANFSQKEFLSYIPPTVELEAKLWADEGWSFIYLDGHEDMHFNDDLNQENNALIFKAYRQAHEPTRRARLGGPCAWVIAPVATPKWAEEVFGKVPNAYEMLWDHLIKILRLDQEDPQQAWKKNSSAIKNRIAKVHEMNVKNLHFKGPGTDLTVELNPTGKFYGGTKKTSTGNEILVNIPTEEFFTTPNFRKTQGYASVTRPVQVLGKTVEGAHFEFHDGKVVSYSATKSKDALDAFFNMDEGARFLGEVALVDCSSPIYKLGKVYNSILIDENAACHIALGAGFPNVFDNGFNLTKEELKNHGCNDSLVHTDFMIGSDKINVTGIDGNNKSHAIIRDGFFVI